MIDLLRTFFTQGVTQNPIINLTIFQVMCIIAPTLAVLVLREALINARARHECGID